MRKRACLGVHLRDGVRECVRACVRWRLPTERRRRKLVSVCVRVEKQRGKNEEQVIREFVDTRGRKKNNKHDVWLGKK